MATVVDCTGSTFKGIFNPYTGEEMHVKMVITPDGKAMYFAPDTYSTSQEFDTPAEARRQWSRVDGVYGCRPGDEARCAYTGEVLIPNEGSYIGGFDPTVFHSMEEFLYYATMRDGKATRPAPSGVSRVEPVQEKAPAPLSREPAYIDGELEEAGRIIEKSGVKFEKRTVVTAGIDLSKKGRKGGK